MELAINETDTQTFIKISGKLTFQDHPHFNEKVSELKNSGKNVVIDLEKLEIIDSAGIGMIFLADSVISDGGATLTLKNPTGQVKRIFEITDISKQIKVVEE